MSADNPPVTADELIKMPEIDCRYELVKGELRRYSFAGWMHGMVSARFNFALAAFVENNSLGVVVSANTGFQLASDPDTVRAPDGAFLHKERIPEIGLPEGFWPGPPDLAVEVIDPPDTYSDVLEKLGHWLDAGTRMVIIIDSPNRTVMVYSSSGEAVRLTESGIIDFGDVVPGFSYPVTELFR